MKQFKLTFVLTMLMSMVGLQAFANWDRTTKVPMDGLYYYLDNDNLQAQVTSMTSGKYTGNIVIPDNFIYEGQLYSVTSIGERAFYNCSALTSITIPNSVTSMGNYAFYDCSALTSVNIPNSVKEMGKAVFQGCRNLISIAIPDDVKTIGNYAFNGCSSLAFITLGSNVTRIENYAFSGCSSLTSITIPSSVWHIGENAFQNCNSLTSITIPSNVWSIGENAFKGCDNLISVTLNSNAIVSSDEEGLRVMERRFGAQVKEYIIGEDVRSIGNYAFASCDNLSTVTIGNNVTNIGDYAFGDCKSLNSVSIGNRVTSVGISAFSNCINLSSITLPNSLMTIGDFAFCNCTSLSSIIIPCNVTTIGIWAFYECKTLTAVTIPDNVESIGELAFGMCSNLISVTIDSNPVVSKSYTSDSNLMEIFGYQVKEYIIGDNVKSIGDYAFESYNDLTSVAIGNNVISIGKHAFSSCNTLPSIIIPNSVTTIGDYAFAHCNSLSSITIPSSVTSIGTNAFYDCKGIKKVIVEDIAAWCGITFSNSFSNPLYYSNKIYSDENTEIINLIIPNNVKNIGSEAFAYCRGLTSVTIPNSVTGIGSSAFMNCSELTSVTIGNGVTSIGSSSFSGCSRLTSVTIPNSVTSIGNSAFRDCVELTSVAIGNSVTSIGNSSFQNCSGLTFVTIPNSVTNIGSYAFGECRGLTALYIFDLAAWCNISFESASSNPLFYARDLYLNDGKVINLEIPVGVSTVPNHAFQTSSIKSVTLPNGLNSIGKEAFWGCFELENIVIPNTVKTIGENAFANCMGLYSVTSLINIPFKLDESVFTYTGTDYDMDIMYGIAKLYVPQGRSSVYSMTTGWKKFTNIIETDTKFNLTYKIDGEVYKNYEIQATEVITPEPEPYKEGYVFSGWSEIPHLMPAHDLTVTGSFTFDTGIGQINSEVNNVAVIYTLDGKRINKPQRGLNIIRMNDGTTRKVVIK